VPDLPLCSPFPLLLDLCLRWIIAFRSSDLNVPRVTKKRAAPLFFRVASPLGCPRHALLQRDRKDLGPTSFCLFLVLPSSADLTQSWSRSRLFFRGTRVYARMPGQFPPPLLSFALSILPLETGCNFLYARPGRYGSISLAGPARSAGSLPYPSLLPFSRAARTEWRFQLRVCPVFPIKDQTPGDPLQFRALPLSDAA